MLRAATTTHRALRRAATPVRQMGGGEWVSNSSTGNLFNRVPGAAVEKEGWEGIAILGIFGGLATGAVTLYMSPDSRISTWANTEARYRDAARANGDEIEYGRQYSKFEGKFEQEEMGAMPTLSEE